MLCMPVAADEHHISPGAGAIQAGVNAASSGDVIVLAGGTYSEHNIIITGKSLTFRPESGLTASDVIIDGTGTSPRIFTVTDGSALTIERITIRNGEAVSAPITPFSSGAAGENGGAILSGGTVTITSSVISGCSAGSGGDAPNDDGGAGGSGGAIYTTGPVTVTSSTFTSCSAGRGGSGDSESGNGGTGGSGGAIRAGGNVLITDSTFQSCLAGSGGGGAEGGDGGSGGAVWSSGTVTVISSSFDTCNARNGGYASEGNAGNGGSGGAIRASGTVTVSGTSITGCQAGSGGSRSGEFARAGNGGNGGGIFTAGTVAMTSSSVTSCSAGNRGAGGGTYGTPGTGSAVYSGGSGGSLNFCRIYANQLGQTVYASGMNAENTWWGTSAGAGSTVTGADATPWLVLGIAASPSVVTPSSYWSTITADLNRNSEGALVSGSGNVPDGTPVAFSGSPGTVTPASASTALGAATGVFSPSAGGTATVTATVDGQSAATTLNVIAPVDAAFSASPLSGTAPLTVAFTDESTGSPDQWAWNFGSYYAGDLGISSVQNPTHTYEASGTYTVTLTAKAGVTGDTVSRTGYIMVTDPGTEPIAAAFTADPPLMGDAPLTVQFNDTSAGLPVAWLWSFGDGGTSTDQDPSHTYAATGTYTVTLTAVNGTHTNTLTQPGYVTVTAVPTPSPTAAPVNPYSGGNSGTAYSGSSGGSDSDTGPAPTKQGNIVLFASSAYLAEHSVTPSDIRVMSYSEGRWTPLETRFTGVSGNRFSFTANTDTYSILSLGNTKDGITGLPVIVSAVTPAPAIIRTPATSPSPAAPESRAVAREETSGPVVQQPAADPPAPAAASALDGSSGIPFMILVPVFAGCIVLTGAGWYVRRWWIHRQNPALFREYD